MGDFLWINCVHSILLPTLHWVFLLEKNEQKTGNFLTDLTGNQIKEKLQCKRKLQLAHHEVARQYLFNLLMWKEIILRLNLRL